MPKGIVKCGLKCSEVNSNSSGALGNVMLGSFFGVSIVVPVLDKVFEGTDMVGNAVEGIAVMAQAGEVSAREAGSSSTDNTEKWNEGGGYGIVDALNSANVHRAEGEEKDLDEAKKI